MPYAETLKRSAALLAAARHIQAFARWCRVLELNQQANHSRHDLRDFSRK